MEDLIDGETMNKKRESKMQSVKAKRGEEEHRGS